MSKPIARVTLVTLVIGQGLQGRLDRLHFHSQVDVVFDSLRMIGLGKLHIVQSCIHLTSPVVVNHRVMSDRVQPGQVGRAAEVKAVQDCKALPPWESILCNSTNIYSL